VICGKIWLLETEMIDTAHLKHLSPERRQHLLDLPAYLESAGQASRVHELLRAEIKVQQDQGSPARGLTSTVPSLLSGGLRGGSRCRTSGIDSGWKQATWADCVVTSSVDGA